MDHILGAGAYEWLGVQYRDILTPDQSGGAMSIVDSVSPPNSGPPRHIHHNSDEAFVILTGECEFWMEETRTIKGPGDTVFVPRGTNHTFRVVGNAPCRHLVILTPGGFEAFFRQMSDRAYRIPQDMEKAVEIGRTFDLEFTGPPLGDEN